MTDNRRFVVSYWNFGHRNTEMYHAFSNVQPLDDFRIDLSRYFKVGRHSRPRTIGATPARTGGLRAINMPVNVHIPLISPVLAVEYSSSARPASLDLPLTARPTTS